MTIRAQALTTFNGDYGNIRTGQIFICEDQYFLGLKQRGMAKEAPPLKTLAPNQAPAPEKKEQSPQLPPGDPSIQSAADPSFPEAQALPASQPPTVGPARPSSASRRGRRLSNQT